MYWLRMQLLKGWNEAGRSTSTTGFCQARAVCWPGALVPLHWAAWIFPRPGESLPWEPQWKWDLLGHPALKSCILAFPSFPGPSGRVLPQQSQKTRIAGLTMEALTWDSFVFAFLQQFPKMHYSCCCHRKLHASQTSNFFPFYEVKMWGTVGWYSAIYSNESFGNRRARDSWALLNCHQRCAL